VWGRLVSLLRVAQPDPDGARVLRQRYIYILPTRYGFLYAATLLAVLLGSLNYGSNLGFMYTFLLAGLGLVAMLLTWRNLLGLRIREGSAAPVFAGQDACFDLELENLERGPRFGLEAISEQGAEARLDLPPRGHQPLRLCLASERRGVLVLGKTKVSTRYPLGLFSAWSYVNLDSRCLVYPQPASSGQPAFAADADPAQKSGSQGLGEDDFQGLRRYRAGDSPRQIDWKALAREKGLLTKEFGGAQAGLLWLDWNTLPNTLGIEDRLRLLCRFILVADEQERHYGLRLPGFQLGPDSGPVHRHRCLSALATYPQAP